MSDAPDDPRCPECGESIGARAVYCMHCSADLTEERAVADADGDGAWDRSTTRREPSRTGRDRSTSGQDQPTAGDAPGDRSGDAAGSDDGSDDYEVVDVTPGSSSTDDRRRRELLDPDSILDNTLTVLVGIAGGIVVGVVGTMVLVGLTGSGWALPFGLAAWLGATAYLVRRRTVQGAVAGSGYAVAAVLLAIPVVALSPAVSVDGGLSERGVVFGTLLVFVLVPAAIAAGIGWVASRYVPADGGGSEG